MRTGRPIIRLAHFHPSLAQGTPHCRAIHAKMPADPGHGPAPAVHLEGSTDLLIAGPVLWPWSEMPAQQPLNTALADPHTCRPSL
jgi:hypothetical protein